MKLMEACLLRAQNVPFGEHLLQHFWGAPLMLRKHQSCPCLS